jgi:hypothetical protein
MAWRPPQQPLPEKPVKPRDDSKPSYFLRFLASIAGVILLITAGVGLMNAMKDTTGQGSPLMAIAVLLPAVILIRYALTGVIKAN